MNTHPDPHAVVNVGLDVFKLPDYPPLLLVLADEPVSIAYHDTGEPIDVAADNYLVPLNHVAPGATEVKLDLTVAGATRSFVARWDVPPEPSAKPATRGRKRKV